MRAGKMPHVPGFDAVADDVRMENGPAAGRWYLARGTNLLNDDSGDPRTAAAFSVLMAARKQGQQFTLTHLESLLTQAGFVDLECHSTSPLHRVVIGRKA